VKRSNTLFIDTNSFQYLNVSVTHCTKTCHLSCNVQLQHQCARNRSWRKCGRSHHKGATTMLVPKFEDIETG